MEDSGRSAGAVEPGAPRHVLVTAQAVPPAGYGCVRAAEHQRGLLDGEIRSRDDRQFIIGPVLAGMAGFLFCLVLGSPVEACGHDVPLRSVRQCQASPRSTGSGLPPGPLWREAAYLGLGCR